MELVTPRLRLARAEDPALVVRYVTDNREHLAPWEPTRDDAYFTTEFWEDTLRAYARDEAQGRHVRLHLYEGVQTLRGDAQRTPPVPLASEGGLTLPSVHVPGTSNAADREPPSLARGVGGSSGAERIIGTANLNNIVRGAFHSAHLGFSLHHERQGHGLMKEALDALIAWAFSPEGLHLHRIEANYQPHNGRSAALLDRLGFRQQGFALDYLFLAGAWRDHVMTALINEKW